MAHLGIMIVASEEAAAADLQDRLRSLGYRVVGSAGSCRAALKSLERIPVDVVVVDRWLDGAEKAMHTAAKLRESCPAPVIMVDTRRGEDAPAPDSPADDWPVLRMPFDGEAFKSAVMAALTGSSLLKRLKVCEERFHQLTEGIREIMILYSVSSGQVLFVNSMYEEVLGRSCDSLYQDTTSFFGSVHPEDQGRLDRVLEEMIQKDKKGSIEFRVVRQDGGICWLALRGFPFRSQSDAERRLTLIAKDITRRKQTEWALRESKERLRALYQGLPIPTMVWLEDEGDFLLTDHNRATEELTRSKIRQYLGVAASDFFKDNPEIINMMHRCFNERRPFQQELSRRMVTTGDQVRVIINHTYIPPDWLVMYIEDVTSRRQAEIELRERESRFRTIADFTFDWEYWLGSDGTFLWVSPSCERTTGYDADEFMQDHNLFYEIIHPEDRPVVRSLLMEKAQTKYCHMEYRIFRSDGQVRWISHNCQAVFGADGVWQGRRASCRDVTGRKEVEERLLAYQRELRSLASELTFTEERARRRIAVDLHDRVGHTLAMCQIRLNQLQMTVDEPNVSRTLESVVELVESAISDTRTLILDISPPALYELGLEAALDELAQEIQDKHGIVTSVEDDGLPKPMSTDTRVALYRSAREAMINVVKHAHSPRMKVSIKRVRREISVEIEDEGQGFDTELLQAELSKRKSFGLFSIRERMSHMGGGMQIHSRAGWGTAVYLTAPLEENASGGVS